VCGAFDCEARVWDFVGYRKKLYVACDCGVIVVKTICEKKQTCGIENQNS
jgi:hypothetical protein